MNTHAVRRGARIVAIGLLLSACHSIGPGTIPRDHFDYNAAVAQSWKEQTLRNMVRLRYGEAPVFLDVASVIAQYAREGQITANSQGYDRPNNVGPPIASGAFRYSDRPTITYQPRTGQQLARTLLSSVPLDSVFALVQAGWPVDLTLATTLRTINGLPAHSGLSGTWNPKFLAAVSALAAVSQQGASSVRRAGERTVFVIHEDLSPDAAAAVDRMRTLLRLDPRVAEYEMVTSLFAESNAQIALSTASALDVLSRIAARFEVPSEHVTKGWTFATPELPSSIDAEGESISGIRVHCGDKPPVDAFVATYERGAWFWIDEGDYSSKRIFSFLLMLMSLAEISSGASPVVTIGAG